jgi:ubiquinone/menaquinone biosynthesis C-methylase UbiE
MTDDAEEQKFWSQFIQSKSMDYQDEYSIPINKLLIEVLDEYTSKDYFKTILELGPGWGNYLKTLLETGLDYTCTDISEDVLHYIKRKARLQGKEIKTIHSKWEDFEAYKKYDVVFAYNCFYRIADIKEALAKINRVGNKLRVIGMTSGPEKPHYKTLANQGFKIAFDRRDYIFFINILYQMGIDVNTRIIPLERTYQYNSKSKLLEKETSRIIDKGYDQNQVYEALVPHITIKNNTYCYTHDFNAVLIYW